MTIASAVRPWPGSLEWGGDWLADAAEELARLGFVLRDGQRPGTTPGPRLLIALRDRPTLEHFDPEQVSFWEARDGRGRLAEVTRSTPVPFTRPFSWGHIRTLDRIPVANDFLAFGGTLLGAAWDAREVVLAFTSRAPIVRWAGHFQGVDPYADEIAAFFARLMVPIDYQEEAEARVAAAEPEALYAMFLRHAGRRLRPGSPLRESEPGLASVVDHECHRLAADVPVAWQAGCELLDWLEIG
jgi:hypothetical protein